MQAAGPSVTIVFLVFNRRDDLRVSLRKMLSDSDYARELVEVIVVDNASTDGSAAMVREEFPDVRLIVRERNTGVSAWNEGFAAARTDYILALDDDCYLPPDGLRRAVAAAEEHDADLVSFKVASTLDPEQVFTELYRTGLLTFWGCAVLMRRRVIDSLVGYDPEIFVWANEVELMLRFFDRGFRHLHYPEIVAQHMKEIDQSRRGIDRASYRFNARNVAYVAGKLLWRRDAAAALVALMATDLRDGLRVDRAAFGALPVTVRGFLRGLRRRSPVRAELSRCYRKNFETFAGPWSKTRSPRELIRALPRETLRGGLTVGNRAGRGRRDQYFAERATFYPEQPEVLQFPYAPTSDAGDDSQAAAMRSPARRRDGS